jgi:hypothetical protein
MEHPIHQVRSVSPIGPSALAVVFADGTRRVIEFAPVLHGPYLGPLRNPEVFRQVRVDPEVRTIVWPNGADFDPATLYDWPAYVDELTARAQQWRDEDTSEQ